MKSRIISIALFFTLIAGGVFAQDFYSDGDITAENIEKKGREKNYDWFTFGAWGRGAFAPLFVLSDSVDADGNVKKDNQNGNFFSGTGSTRANYGFEQELYIKGEFDYVGFQLGLAFDGEAIKGSITSGKYWYNYLGAAIWVNPIGNDWLKVMGGTFREDTLRGKIGEVNDGFEEFVLEGAKGEDSIFQAFEENNNQNLGFMISSIPIEGLFIGARVNAPGLWGAAGDFKRAEDVFRNVQFGIGYEIPKNIGHVRLQYLGGYVGKNVGNKRLQKYIEDENKDWDGNGDAFSGIPRELIPAFSYHGTPASIQAAFAFTYVKDLLVDIGFKSYLPVTTSGTIHFPGADYDMPYVKSFGGFTLSAAASYSIAGFSITGRLDSVFGSYRRTSETDKNLYDASSTPLTLDVRLVPKYDFGFMEVGLDFGFQMTGNEIDPSGNPIEPSQTKYRWGIGAFVQRSFNFGYIKAGVTYTSPTIHENKDQIERIADKMVQIPVILGYSF